MTKIPVFEHDDEPVPGLPTRLPEGEFIVWQGRPVAQQIASRVLKTRWVAGYFAVLAAWIAAAGIHDARPFAGILFSVAAMAILAAVALALLELFAWGVQKTTLYTITNRRLVMRIGVALSVTLNLPFRQIASADMSRNRDGSGDIVLSVKEGQRLSWFVLWPHLRPWRFSQPEPALRCIPNVEAAADALKAQLVAAQSGDAMAPTIAVTRPAAERDIPAAGAPLVPAE